MAFLEAHRGDVGLVLTSIDDAKSEEFDTVAFIGPNHLPDNRKLRWCVSLSRARDHLVLACDEQPGGWRGLMRAMPAYLYTESVWPEPATGPGMEDWDDDIFF